MFLFLYVVPCIHKPFACLGFSTATQSYLKTHNVNFYCWNPGIVVREAVQGKESHLLSFVGLRTCQWTMEHNMGNTDGDTGAKRYHQLTDIKLQ